MLTLPAIATTLDTLEDVILNLTLDIGRMAAEGDILGCDLAHGKIASLQAAMESVEDLAREIA